MNIPETFKKKEREGAQKDEGEKEREREQQNENINWKKKKVERTHEESERKNKHGKWKKKRKDTWKRKREKKSKKQKPCSTHLRVVPRDACTNSSWGSTAHSSTTIMYSQLVTCEGWTGSMVKNVKVRFYVKVRFDSCLCVKCNYNYLLNLRLKSN